MKKIVIIGGGFVGSYCARKLEKDFEVTLIDTRDYFEFTPSVLRILVEPDHLDKIQILHKDYLENSKIVLGEVNKFDNNKVFVKGNSYSYDYLIAASGSSYVSPFKKENILHPNRGVELKKYASKLKKSGKILIVGGGLVGVELTGEILDKYPHKEITLIHSHERLIPRNNLKSSRKVEMYFRKEGVNLNLGERFEDKEGKDYDLIFFCTGIKPNLDFKGLDIKLDKRLMLKNMKNVFVGGDISDVKEEKTAQNALAQANVIVKNIFRLEKDKKLKSYKPRKRLLLISLGSKKGILEYKNFSWFGFIPAWMKAFVERRHMIGMKH